MLGLRLSIPNAANLIKQSLRVPFLRFLQAKEAKQFETVSQGKWKLQYIILESNLISELFLCWQRVFSLLIVNGPNYLTY